jgi:hypothetical protein
LLASEFFVPVEFSNTACRSWVCMVGVASMSPVAINLSSNGFLDFKVFHACACMRKQGSLYYMWQIKLISGRFFLTTWSFSFFFHAKVCYNPVQIHCHKHWQRYYTLATQSSQNHCVLVTRSLRETPTTTATNQSPQVKNILFFLRTPKHSYLSISIFNSHEAYNPFYYDSFTWLIYM